MNYLRHKFCGNMLSVDEAGVICNYCDKYITRDEIDLEEGAGVIRLINSPINGGVARKGGKMYAVLSQFIARVNMGETGMVFGDNYVVMSKQNYNEMAKKKYG